MEDTFDLLLSLVGKNPLTIIGVILVAVLLVALIPPFALFVKRIINSKNPKGYYIRAIIVMLVLFILIVAIVFILVVPANKDDSLTSTPTPTIKPQELQITFWKVHLHGVLRPP